MDDHEYSRVFGPIAKGIRSKNRYRQNLTRECIGVLDEKIRPAIRQAQKEIDTQGEWMEFNAGDRRPYIRIRTDEIQFICLGDTVEIVTKVGSSPPSNDAISIREISEELVVDKIASFFRRLYNLPVVLEDQ